MTILKGIKLQVLDQLGLSNYSFVQSMFVARATNSDPFEHSSAILHYLRVESAICCRREG
jgi:DNA-directed RNA polymerase subunit N (RpoN/RPB10)